MAEIPVERKEGGSFPWWLIPLLLLLLLLPLLYFCNRGAAVVDNTNHSNGNANRGAATTTGANGGNMVGDGSSTSTTTTTTTGGNGNTAVVMNSNGGAGDMTGSGGSGSTTNMNHGAVVKDVNEFGSASDKATLVGRGFFVDGVRVERVLSDKVFTVKSGSGEMFVMLDDNLDSAGGKEKQIRMKPGQTVNLGGEFRNVPTGEVKEEVKEGGLNKAEYARMKGQNVYLHATSVSDAK